MTRRKDMIALLRTQSMTVSELTRYFCTEPKEILADLQHIEQSVKPKERLEREPAACKSCGYVFASREKMKRPSKCPVCKEEKITEPIFSIAPRN